MVTEGNFQGVSHPIYLQEIIEPRNQERNFASMLRNIFLIVPSARFIVLVDTFSFGFPNFIIMPDYIKFFKKV